MADPFAVGSPVRVREVLHGAEWASWDERVLADDGTLLVTVKPAGTAMHFPPHPVPHPWGHLEAWQGTTVLKQRRAGDWYSVWRFFDAAGRALSTYVNFETPVVRTADGVDVNDLQLDVVVELDGTWRWKDVQHLAPSLASGRITSEELLATLAAAAEVADLLERDDRWWAPWDEWSPQDGTL
ncbi:hypothetical protein ASG76_00190 [Nocardioides sp. Soil774]|uniref:DUF402 domain-containing protein n=1 Tax=Nocardioides sp. Soil774 TaxID=1736408 RepID=UPI00070123E2|nr:DUF402 domain-containing protein [Nocardioides sp. Soil774]KRE97191.1 hypothetical protein ASG76_00190 [Nocardioides sp. Soil774]